MSSSDLTLMVSCIFVPTFITIGAIIVARQLCRFIRHKKDHR